ncbi:MAG: hypothetical protein QXL94_00325 [Candidatus Parvarchaeum sp.]
MVDTKVVTAQESASKKALSVYVFIDFVLLFPIAAKLIYFSGGTLLSIIIGILFGVLGVVLLVFGIFPFFASKFKGDALVADIDRIDKFVGAHTSQIEAAVEANKGQIESTIESTIK